ncbi:MAG: AraC family transcriptional regulator, partial [Jatrophihabitantaceae bacterium]
AHNSGFDSGEYFSRAFRREFGLSPRAYRSARVKDRAIHAVKRRAPRTG